MLFPEKTEKMLCMLKEKGYAAYFTGGCVRDALLGETPHDYDISTDALPEQIMEVFGEKNCCAYGSAFGTVGVKADGAFAEVTTFRTEGAYTDSRHPERVSFTHSAEKDLARRDFTCNAMAYAPWEGLLDPFGGRKDLKNGVLRCVGVPQARFREDALRILRGMRFCAVKGLVPEPLTHAAMQAGAFRLRQISAERVYAELCGMLTGQDITRVLLQYPEVLAVRIPEIMPCIAFSQHSQYHAYTVWEHMARAVGNAAPVLTVRLAMLLHDIGKPRCYTVDAGGGHFKGHAGESAAMADSILRRLRCENRQRQRVVRLIAAHRNIPDTMASVRHLLGRMGEEEFALFLQVLTADSLSKIPGQHQAAGRIARAAEYAEICRKEGLCCRVEELSVGGEALLSMGLHGEEIGKMLRYLLEAVIEGVCRNEREALLKLAAERMAHSKPENMNPADTYGGSL
jgi:tRNA nucleotidyltransferase (CCA-adding enzyme)